MENNENIEVTEETTDAVAEKNEETVPEKVETEAEKKERLKEEKKRISDDKKKSKKQEQEDAKRRKLEDAIAKQQERVNKRIRRREEKQARKEYAKQRQKKKNIFQRTISFFENLFSRISTLIERGLKNRTMLKILSLFMAVFTFLFVYIQGEDLNLSGSGKVVTNVPITVEYNSEYYILEGAPEFVDLVLIGNSNLVSIAESKGDFEIYLDLTGYQPGKHTVPLSYRNISEEIEVRLDPSVVNVEIHEKNSMQMTLNDITIGEEKVDKKLSIAAITLSTNEVTITGTQDKNDQIEFVNALIDVSSITTTGEVEIPNIPIVAYDKEGNQVDVQITPRAVSATVLVDSPQKDLNLNVTPIGKVAEGFAIKTIVTNPDFITLYAPDDVLERYLNLELEVDVTGISEDRRYTELLELPSGARAASHEEIIIDVILEEQIEQTTNIRIIPKNIPEGLVVSAATLEDATVDITLKGTESVLNELIADTAKFQETVVAWIDLTDLLEGEHTVDIQLEVNDVRVEVTLDKFKTNIILGKREN
jgi:YbbR domain-containing protein